MNEQLRNRTNNTPNPPDSILDRHTADAICSACNPERISRLHASLEAIRQRIEDAYSLISTDLPGISRELISAFDQAGEALDDLSRGESGGMIGRLQAFLDSLEERVGLMRNTTMHSIETLHNARQLFSAPWAAPTAASLETQPASDSGRAGPGSSLIDAADALEKLLEESLDLQGYCLGRIQRCALHSIPSLANSVSNIAVILQDLASRSNAMEAILHRTMTSLQTHDIIDQDIAAISGGLQEAFLGVIRVGRGDGNTGILCFLEQFSTLSLDLMTRIFSVIRTHGLNLEHYMDRIEESLNNINEGVDALNSFFFLSTGGKSFLDILGAEMSEAIQDLEQLIGSLEDRIARLDAARSQLSRTRAELESGDITFTEGAVRDELARLAYILESTASQAHLQSTGNRIQELRVEFREAHEWLRSSFVGIRKLLIDALAGINLPTTRCLEAIGSVRGDIRDLEGISDQAGCFLQEMQDVAYSISSIRKGLSDHPGRGEGCKLTHDLERIVDRLKNPHSNLLATEGEACRKDSDLTIF